MSRLPSLGPRGEGWVALQFVLLALIALAGVLGGGDWGATVGALASLAGLLLVLAGGILVARGLLDLGRNLTPVPHPREGARLVDTGVYALVRHPIYGGLILGAAGWGLLTASASALLLVVVLAIFFDLKSRREEAWLVAHYVGYASYMRRTRRFIPLLY